MKVFVYVVTEPLVFKTPNKFCANCSLGRVVIKYIIREEQKNLPLNRNLDSGGLFSFSVSFGLIIT